MPSVSQAQQHLMGAAYARAKAGHPMASDPQMSLAQLHDFASTGPASSPMKERAKLRRMK